jgi:hypothetical protein
MAYENPFSQGGKPADQALRSEGPASSQSFLKPVLVASIDGWADHDKGGESAGSLPLSCFDSGRVPLHSGSASAPRFARITPKSLGPILFAEADLARHT